MRERAEAKKKATSDAKFPENVPMVIGRKKTVAARMLDAEEKRITDSQVGAATMSLADQLKNASNLLTQNTK